MRSRDVAAEGTAERRRRQARDRRQRARLTPAIEPLFLNRRDSAVALSVSESLILVFERRGWLRPIRLPAKLRCVRYSVADVRALAERICRGEIA